MQGVLKKTLHSEILNDILLNPLSTTLLTIWVKPWLSFGMNKDQHFVKVFSACPVCIFTGYGKEIVNEK
jgi:hypothetical protein